MAALGYSVKFGVNSIPSPGGGIHADSGASAPKRRDTSFPGAERTKALPSMFLHGLISDPKCSLKRAAFSLKARRRLELCQHNFSGHLTVSQLSGRPVVRQAHLVFSNRSVHLVKFLNNVGTIALG